MNVIASSLARTTSWRARVIASVGPITAAAGLGWALVQPYRVTLLHPDGQGFWWLFVEPPLWVLIVGLAFAWRIAPGLLEDLDAAEG